MRVGRREPPDPVATKDGKLSDLLDALSRNRRTGTKARKSLQRLYLPMRRYLPQPLDAGVLVRRIRLEPAPGHAGACRLRLRHPTPLPPCATVHPWASVVGMGDPPGPRPGSAGQNAGCLRPRRSANGEGAARP